MCGSSAPPPQPEAPPPPPPQAAATVAATQESQQAAQTANRSGLQSTMVSGLGAQDLDDSKSIRRATLG